MNTTVDQSPVTLDSLHAAMKRALVSATDAVSMLRVVRRLARQSRSRALPELVAPVRLTLEPMARVIDAPAERHEAIVVEDASERRAMYARITRRREQRARRGGLFAIR